MAGSSGSAVVQRRVGFDAGDKVAVKLKVCCRRRSKRLETSLDNNDTKMPALGGYWYTATTAGDPAADLSERKSSKPRPRFVSAIVTGVQILLDSFPTGPTAEISAVP